MARLGSRARPGPTLGRLELELASACTVAGRGFSRAALSESNSCGRIFRLQLRVVTRNSDSESRSRGVSWSGVTRIAMVNLNAAAAVTVASRRAWARARAGSGGEPERPGGAGRTRKDLPVARFKFHWQGLTTEWTPGPSSQSEPESRLVRVTARESPIKCRWTVCSSRAPPSQRRSSSTKEKRKEQREAEGARKRLRML